MNYSTDELLEMNQLYEGQEYAKNYVSIGNDGGGRQLLMKSEREATDFFFIDDGDMQVDENDTAFNFIQWIQDECLS